MASHFSERLDFLMSLTNTSNSALARELSFDASYISRIRNGKRGMPLRQPFVEPAAAYFTERVVEPYQIQAIEQALRLPGSWPSAPEHAADALARWMRDDSATVGHQLDKLFASLEHPPSEQTSVSHAVCDDGTLATVRLFFDDSGKRAATEQFLQTVLASEKPARILAFSDEDLSWFIGDSAFAQRWLSLLKKLIASGSTVTILHTITRDINEMLSGVHSWLPLYLTGSVTSYYCPRIRDGICRRTLFVVPGLIAMSSTSIGAKTDGMAATLITEPRAVKAREKEFRNLLALCKPLVQATPLSDSKRMNRVLSLFDQVDETELAIICGSKEIALSALNDKLSPTPQKHFKHLMSHATMKSTPLLPDNVIVIIAESVGFGLAHSGDPAIMLHVTERLLTATLAEYLR